MPKYSMLFSMPQIGELSYWWFNVEERKRWFDAYHDRLDDLGLYSYRNPAKLVVEPNPTDDRVRINDSQGVKLSETVLPKYDFFRVESGKYNYSASILETPRPGPPRVQRAVNVAVDDMNQRTAFSKMAFCHELGHLATPNVYERCWSINLAEWKSYHALRREDYRTAIEQEMKIANLQLANELDAYTYMLPYKAFFHFEWDRKLQEMAYGTHVGSQLASMDTLFQSIPDTKKPKFESHQVIFPRNVRGEKEGVRLRDLSDWRRKFRDEQNALRDQATSEDYHAIMSYDW